VLKSSLLIAMAVYTYLRLIVDHHGTSQLQVLRQKEVDFCISLLRERVSKSGDSWGWLGRETCRSGDSVCARWRGPCSSGSWKRGTRWVLRGSPQLALGRQQRVVCCQRRL